MNFINLGPVYTITTAYYIHEPELMKLIFAVLCVVNDGQTRCYETERFFTLIYTYKLRSFLVHLHWKIVLLCVAVCMDGFDTWAYDVSKQISNDILTLSSIT